MAELKRRVCEAQAEAKALRAESHKLSGVAKQIKHDERLSGRSNRRHLGLAYAWARGRKYDVVEPLRYLPPGVVRKHDSLDDVNGSWAWDFVIEAFKAVREHQAARVAGGGEAELLVLHPMQAFKREGLDLLCDGWLSRDPAVVPVPPRLRVKRPYAGKAEGAQDHQTLQL